MRPFTLNIKGRLLSFNSPVIMGIVNVTPDSFYSGSRMFDAASVEENVKSMLSDGADIIDIGACSTRPGAIPVKEEEELQRLDKGLNAIRKIAPHAIVSVDTFRPRVAMLAVTEMGADIVNDISGLTFPECRDMIETIALLKVPYILSHNRPQNDNSSYVNVSADVCRELASALDRLNMAGIADIIVDPGIGFAKNPEENYELLANLEMLCALHCPVLVGISRKSLLYKKFGTQPENCLEASTALNAFCLDRGADILRVHDVKAARQTVEIYNQLRESINK